MADLGGSIITGIDGNPLAVLAKQLNIALHNINTDDVPLYLRDGSQICRDVDMQVFSDCLPADEGVTYGTAALSDTCCRAQHICLWHRWL